MNIHEKFWNENGFRRISCPICKKDDAREHSLGGDAKGIATGIYRTVRCRGCGLVYMNPMPGDEFISSFYHGFELNYYRGGTSGHAPGRASMVSGLANVGRALDIGTGDGSYLSHMKSLGWQVAGVEFNPESARRQRDELRLDVRTGSLAETGFEPASFDVITYWDVFEHIPNPAGELNLARNLLSPGGILIHSMPNIESLEARIFRRNWDGFDVPRHLFHYSPRTWSLLAGGAGLSINRVIYSTTATSFLNSLRKDLASSVTTVPGADTGTGGLEGADAKKRMKKLIFDFMIVPALKVLDSIHMGGHFIIAAKQSRKA